MAPVHEAARQNGVEELRRLLDEEPGLLEAEEDGGDRERPLHLACFWGGMEAACLLLDRGADINSLNGSGVTPFMLACSWGHVDLVAMLLARGADPTMVTSSRRTALMHVSGGSERDGVDHVAVIRLLLKDGRVPVDARDVNGATALRWACLFGRTERARVLLLEGRADPTIACHRGDTATPMAAAQRYRHPGCVQVLKWFEGELERAASLSKARAVVDATESISKAPEKVGAKTEAEAQRAREVAAPAYLRGRVERREALPCVELVEEQRRRLREEEEEEERRAVLKFAVTMLKDDLHVELMEGLRLR